MNIAAPASPEAAATSGRTLLYIDDDPANTFLMGLIVARRPEMTFLAASAGIPGIVMAQKHLPNLVLLDFHLPDMNGDQVLKHLRGDPLTAGIPVVILSGDATPVQAKRMLGSVLISSSSSSSTVEDEDEHEDEYDPAKLGHYRMLALGARRYITKPFNVVALLASVEAILSAPAC